MAGTTSLPNYEYHAMRWTEAGGMQELGALNGGDSHAQATSADGRVVVGNEFFGSYSLAFRWTAASAGLLTYAPISRLIG